MQLSSTNVLLTNCYIHICINNIEIRHNNKFQNIYFSFIHNNKFHFSSAISSKTSYINDDIFIHFQNQDEIPDSLKVQRWESHMILLEHEIDITELRGRGFTKKKLQTKHNEIISFTFTLLTKNQIKFINSPVKEIMQHYIKIFKLSVHDPMKVDEEELSYFQIETKQQKYILPVTNSQIVIQLPAEFQVSYFKNNQLYGKSDWFASSEFANKSLDIGLYNQKGSYVSKIRLNLQWGTNLLFKKLQSSILYEAHELCIYDIEVKFDNFSEFTGAKLKFVYGAKAFEILGEFNHRVVQFQRIIYIILKSEDEEVAVYCEKNNKIAAQAKFSTTQMISHKVIAVKKYFTDPVSHRPLGYVKFLCQKAKNLSLPASNSFWKQFNKKKHPSKLMLRIEQLSIQSQSKKNLVAVIKTEKQQYQIQPLVNFLNFQSDNATHEPLLLTIQQKSSIYILIKQKLEQNSVSQNDFLGISAINYEELRLGSNPLKMQFYKNQQLTVEANCIINKIVPYPFIKSSFQQQIPISPHTKTCSISAEILNIQFEPYFQTFQYEQKTQVYCIFEVGKIKKVVVLEPSKQDSLHFQVTNSSDTLNFVVCETDFIKAKMTFLVSSLGKDQEVYGWSVLKIKLMDFLQKQAERFENIEIRNQHSIFIGNLSLQMKKGIVSSSELLTNRQIKKIKNDLIKVNQSIEKMEKNLSKNKNIFQDSIKTPILERRVDKKEKKDLPVRYVSRKQYSPERIKLPRIQRPYN